MKTKAPPRSDAGAAVSLVGILLLVLAAAAGEAKPDTGRPDPGLASVGKHVYKGYCASCHGVEAKGDGPVAEYLKIPPTDLTRAAAENGGEFPFDDMEKVIDGRQEVREHGSDMPIWGDVFLEAEGGEDAEAVRQRIAALVHYLWSIQVEDDA